MLIEVSGVRHPRHARIIEAQIKSQKGVSTVSVSGTGFIQLEYNKENTSEEKVIEQIKRSGLKVIKIEDFHTHEPKKQTDSKEEPEHEHKHDEHKHDENKHVSFSTNNTKKKPVSRSASYFSRIACS